MKKDFLLPMGQAKYLLNNISKSAMNDPLQSFTAKGTSSVNIQNCPLCLLGNEGTYAHANLQHIHIQYCQLCYQGILVDNSRVLARHLYLCLACSCRTNKLCHLTSVQATIQQLIQTANSKQTTVMLPLCYSF